jgi:hypothetical protein
MLPLQLAGIKMSDDASKTLGGAVRAWLGTCGFLLMMFGGYFIYEHGNLYVGIPMLAGGLPLFVLPWAWDRVIARFRADPLPKKLKYLHYEDSEIGGAIRDMASYSAWAKWFASQSLAVDNHRPTGASEMMFTASSIVHTALINGKLIARGRPSGAVEYEKIPTEAWRLIAIRMQPHPASLWHGVVIPYSGVDKERIAKLLDYDSIIVNSREFENLWRKRDPRYDRLRQKILKKAKKVGADPEHIKYLNGEMAFRDDHP